MLLSPFILNFLLHRLDTISFLYHIHEYMFVLLRNNIPFVAPFGHLFQYYVFKSFTTISSVAFMHTITPVTFINSRSLHCLISISCIAVIPFCISFILSLHSCILSINSCSIYSFNPTLTVPSNFS